MNNSSVLMIVMVAVLLVVIGIIYVNYQKPGSADAHGCIGSAGYTWCAASQKCIRSWEENCTVAPQIVGNGTDSHGCKGGEGYTWCAVNQKCLRVWEEKCEVFLPEGALPNIMPADACPAAGGRVVDVKGEALCPEGELPIAEVYSGTGAKKACCRASAVQANSTNGT